MKIAFDVNSVLRDTFGKAEQIYQKFFIDELFDETEFEYGLNLPVKNLSNLKDHFKFSNDEELFEFFYQDFTMQIFGNAGSSEMNTFNIFNEIYEDLRDDHDILVISDEIGKSKPATLFFLSKYGCLVEKIKFFSKVTMESLWDECNIIITANPELFENKPENTTMVKFNTSYNEDLDCEHEIDSLSQFKDLYKQLEIKKNDYSFG